MTFLGDGWVFAPRSDVSPLLAAAVALYVADLELELAGAAAMTIFWGGADAREEALRLAASHGRGSGVRRSTLPLIGAAPTSA